MQAQAILPTWPQTQPQVCHGVSRDLVQPGVGSKGATDVAEPSIKNKLCLILEGAALSAPRKISAWTEQVLKVKYVQAGERQWIRNMGTFNPSFSLSPWNGSRAASIPLPSQARWQLTPQRTWRQQRGEESGGPSEHGCWAEEVWVVHNSQLQRGFL